MSQPGNRRGGIPELKEAVQRVTKGIQKKLAKEIKETEPQLDALREQTEALASQVNQFRRGSAVESKENEDRSRRVATPVIRENLPNNRFRRLNAYDDFNQALDGIKKWRERFEFGFVGTPENFARQYGAAKEKAVELLQEYKAKVDAHLMLSSSYAVLERNYNAEVAATDKLLSEREEQKQKEETQQPESDTSQVVQEVKQQPAQEEDRRTESLPPTIQDEEAAKVVLQRMQLEQLQQQPMQQQQQDVKRSEEMFKSAMENMCKVQHELTNMLIRLQAEKMSSIDDSADTSKKAKTEATLKGLVDRYNMADLMAGAALSTGAKSNEKFEADRRQAVRVLSGIYQSKGSDLSKLYLLELKIRERQQGWYCRFAMWIHEIRGIKSPNSYYKVLDQHEKNTKFLIDQLRILEGMSDTQKELRAHKNLVDLIRVSVYKSTEQFKSIFKVDRLDDLNAERVKKWVEDGIKSLQEQQKKSVQPPEQQQPEEKKGSYRRMDFD